MKAVNSKKVLSLLSLLLLAACGGGGSTPIAPPTSVTGTTTPPTAPASGVNYSTANMLIPPNSGGTWASIIQSTKYFFDSASSTASALKVSSLIIGPVDTQNSSYTSITTGAAYSSDPALGQATTTTHTSSNASSLISSNSPTVGTLANQPAAILSQPGTVWLDSYVLPYSTTLNPAGYTYQTFGTSMLFMASFFNELYYSTGLVSDAATLPASGSASYTGQVAASYVDTVSRAPYDAVSTVNVSIDFTTRNVTFSTTGTTTLSAGTFSGANANLNFRGTLSYAAGSNTFTGVVTSTNGMSGNVTGRVYGPGISAATANKVAGSPPEIGGTFVLMKPGVGVIQGSFGGN